MSKEESKIQNNDVLKRSYNTTFKIMLVFGLSAIAGAVFGRGIGNTFNIGPTGTLIGLAISYAVAWFIVVKLLVRK